MISRHDDSEALARVLRYFGLGLIRGAGAGTRRRDRGGAEAAHGAVASLREDFSIAMTADIPPGPARNCGLGIVIIGSRSGRPIVPFAVATSRYRAVNSWDRMTINLPSSASSWATRSTYRARPERRSSQSIGNASRRR